MHTDPNPNATVEDEAGAGDPEAPESPAAPETPAADTTDWKAEFLKAKPKIELANRVLAEQEERERRAEESRGHTPAADGSPRNDRITRLRERVEVLAEHDPIAAFQLEKEAEEEQRELERDQKTADLLTLSTVPEDKRAALLAFRQRNRSHFGSLAAAKDAFESREAKAEAAKLREENERLRKAKPADEPARDAARTLPPAGVGGGRDTATPQTKPQGMTRDDFDAKVQELYDNGDAKGARALQRQLTEHKIVLRR